MMKGAILFRIWLHCEKGQGLDIRRIVKVRRLPKGAPSMQKTTPVAHCGTPSRRDTGETSAAYAAAALHEFLPVVHACKGHMAIA